MLSEIIQRERQILYDITFMWNLNKENKLKITKTNIHNIENKLVVTSKEKGYDRSGILRGPNC